MSSAAMPGRGLVAHRQCEVQLAVGTGPGAHAEMDQVVPVERRQQARGRHACPAEVIVRFALHVEVRHLVAAHERRHARIVELDESSRVFERRPDHVLHPRLLRGVGHCMGFGPFPVRRKVIPEERHAIRAVGAVERTCHGCLVGDIRRDDFGAGSRQCARLRRIRVTRDGAHGEFAVRIRKNRPHEAAALRAGRTRHRDDLLRHVFHPSVSCAIRRKSRRRSFDAACRSSRARPCSVARTAAPRDR